MHQDICYNASLNIDDDNEWKMDKDKVAVYKQLRIYLNVAADGQHDGHLWDTITYEHYEKELIDKITNKLKEEVTKFVQKVKPFSIHI